MRTTVTLITMGLFAILGCAHGKESEKTMHASLKPRKEVIEHARDLTLDLTITNDTGQEVQLNAIYLPYGNAMLRFADADGKTLTNVYPPSVPPADDGQKERKTLAAGESAVFHYVAGFSSDLAPGSYVARFEKTFKNDKNPRDWTGTLKAEARFTIRR